MSYPMSWKVRTIDGYLTSLKSPDGVVEYSIFAMDNEGSFAKYRRSTEASTNFDNEPGSGETVTEEDITVDGRQGFFIHIVSDRKPPPNYAGEPWCGGCVGRNYSIDWSPTQVLEIAGGARRNWAKYEETIERIVASIRHL